MRKSRFSETQIVGILRDAESGVPVPDLLRTHGVSRATTHRVLSVSLSRLLAPLGRPIEGQIRVSTRQSRPIVLHPDSYPRSGGCQAVGGELTSR